MKRLISTRSYTEESRVKIILVGDQNVGKTSFLMSYCSSNGANDRKKSIFNNFNAHMKYKDKIVKLDFWELPAAEEYEKMRQINYPQTDAYFIVYSIDDPKSLLNSLTFWLSEIKISNYENNPIVFIGNKSDLRNTKPEDGVDSKPQDANITFLTLNEAKEKITETLGKGNLHFECSSVMQTGINEICLETVKAIFEKRDKNSKADRDTCCTLI